MEIVKELMVPIEEYATVHEEMTVREAIKTLEIIRAKHDLKGRDYKHRSLLVLDKENHIVGKLSQIDVVMSLEPKYRTETGHEAIAHTASAGLSPSLLKSMMQWYSLWDETFEQRCQKVLNMKVKECMYTPRSDEYVKESESLEVAIHQLVMGRHQHLLVRRGREIVGVLRLTDIFQEIAWAGGDQKEQSNPVNKDKRRKG